jgi:hypothetical protein
MKRQKTKLEKWFSFSRHRRRFGSRRILTLLDSCDLNQLKNTIIDNQKLNYTHGSEVSLEQHLENLKEEFAGQSELCYYHAILIVLLRREVDQSKIYPEFVKLWQQFDQFLIESLNTRWLVAAADTFADHSDNTSERAGALAVTALVNTVKLCETERLITGAPKTLKVDSNIDMQADRLPLWDGTSAFAIGTDDTLRNFRWRLESLLSGQGKELHSIKILKEVFIRLQVNDNVYRRFREHHSRQRTAWW